MYLPTQFAEDRTDVLHAAMRAAGLATLVTMTADGLIASHVPLMLDPEAGPHGTLYGHLARANPQATAEPVGQALAIFTGPDAYITPSWYPAKREHGRVVPTWNYVAIHAYGMLEVFDDAERLHALVSRLTDRHEAPRAAQGEVPWAVDDAPAPFVQGQLKGIRGFALPIARLQGKWKMSQNRAEADRAGVVAGLAEQGREDVAALVAAPPVSSR
ncbi:MAG: FMN-binding negative transcriptional regulator [Proteobacteria bacterium]|nr:FMN-binding negative transcriptional regulator [Pseudomonadota bacterium]